MYGFIRFLLYPNVYLPYLEENSRISSLKPTTLNLPEYMNMKRGISRISLRIHFLVSIEKNSEKGKWISYRDFSQEIFKCFLHLEVTRNISHDFSSISSGYLYLFSNGKSPNFFFNRALKFDKLECVFQQRIFFLGFAIIPYVKLY